VIKIIDRAATASHQLIKITALLIITLLALALTGCRGNSTGTDPVPWPASNPHTPLDEPSGYTGYGDEYGSYGDESGGYPDDPGYPYDPGYPADPGYPDPGYPDEPGDSYTDEPDSDTNPCAFPGDALCPDTPITIPPPRIDPPF
jgi:hypothetical protein